MTVRCMRTWHVPLQNGHAELPVLILEDGPPQVTVQQAMSLVLESRNTSEYVTRYNNDWKAKVHQMHSIMFRNAIIPEGFASFRDGRDTQCAKLTNKSTMPLSCVFALLAVAIGRGRPDWQRPGVTAFINIVHQMFGSGLGVPVEWRRIGDNKSIAFRLTGDAVSGSLLWTQPALALWLLGLATTAMNAAGKDWFDDFSFDEPFFSRVLLLCFDPQVLKKQAMLQLRGASAWGFLASHFMQHLEDYTGELETKKYLPLQRAAFEDSLMMHFTLQRKVRLREDARRNQHKREQIMLTCFECS